MARRRQPAPSEEDYKALAPDLAVEVLSPSNTPAEMRLKLGNYLAVGTVVWVVDSDARTVEVYTPGAAVRVFGENDTRDGGTLFPDFRAALKDFFAS